MSTGAGPSASSFPNGFANGVTIRGLPLSQTHPGKVVWLGNSAFLAPGGRAASDGNAGTFNSPCATLAGALSKCVGGRGDVIMVKPNHQEIIETTVSIGVAGVAIVGLGFGSSRPYFYIGDAVGTCLSIVADNVAITNCVILGHLANVTNCFVLGGASVTGSIAGTILTVTAVGSGALYPGALLAGSVTFDTRILNQLSGTTGGVGTYQVSVSQTSASTTITTSSRGFTVHNCDITDVAFNLNFLTIVRLSTVDRAHDFLTITGNRIIMLATSGVANLLIAASTNSHITIADNYFQSATTGTGAVIPISTGKVLNALTLINNRFNVVNAAATATGYIITTDGSTNTGFIDGNMDHAAPTTPLFATLSSGFVYGLNYHANVADLQGYLVPGADS